MSSKLVAKAVAGAIAIAMGGTAVAQTSLNTTTGDLFLNIVDYTISSGVESSSSYVFDTGVSLASFNPTQTYSYNLSSDPNFANNNVLSPGGGASVDYSVLATTVSGTGRSAIYTADFTTNIDSSNWSSNVGKTNVANAEGAIATFFTGANGTASTTKNSAWLTGANTWGSASTEGIVSNQLLNDGVPQFGDNAAPGTPLAFYTEQGSTASVFAGTWNLITGANGTSLVWNPQGSSVPLPTPIVLLLSGLGLMGLIARRGKAAGFAAALS
jgi:hypothetical protein